MKACHITTVHQPFDNRIFHKECKSLRDAGHEVVLIAQHDKSETIDGIRISPLPKSKGRLGRMLRLPFRAFRLAVEENADVYHFHDPELLPVGVMLKAFTRAKVVYDAHEDYPAQIMSKYYLPVMVRRPVSIAVGMIERMATYFMDAVVAATDSIKLKFAYHKNAIAVRNFPVISRFVQKRHRADGVFRLVYVGGITKIRGIVQCVQALALISKGINIRLTLCGSFSPQVLESEVKSMKGFERVDFKGWVRVEDAVQVMSESDAGYVCFLPEPNHLEAMPNKLFEYMAAGLPVIASNFPLWKDIVESNRCGICVDPEDPNDIARAIEWLAGNPQICAEMGENGRRAVFEKYSWDGEAKKLVALYDSFH